jgi:hypothetical protein
VEQIAPTHACSTSWRYLSEVWRSIPPFRPFPSFSLWYHELPVPLQSLCRYLSLNQIHSRLLLNVKRVVLGAMPREENHVGLQREFLNTAFEKDIRTQRNYFSTFPGDHSN